jgi:hypothetical protein
MWGYARPRIIRKFAAVVVASVAANPVTKQRKFLAYEFEKTRKYGVYYSKGLA